MQKVVAWNNWKVVRIIVVMRNEFVWSHQGFLIDKVKWISIEEFFDLCFRFTCPIPRGITDVQLYK